MASTAEAYFAALWIRLSAARPLKPWPPERPWPIAGWRPQPRACHANVDRLCLHQPRYRAVRGWLRQSSHIVVAHSALFDACTRELLDITPLDQIDPTAAPRYSGFAFVRHLGSEAEFFLIATRYPQWIYA